MTSRTFQRNAMNERSNHRCYYTERSDMTEETRKPS